jgi:hypothetical protein
MIALVLHNPFSWVFSSYMLKFDTNLWASLLSVDNFACFFVASFKSIDTKWSDIKTNSYIWDSSIITSKIGKRKICQLALAMFIYKICKDCNFHCRLWVSPKWFKSNNKIIEEFYWTLFLWLCPNP